ncbi:related to tetracycline resistance proteins [Fusarium mangiferae]|uniref:Related to tetracycline resistance proteins n=1 Tax=Fusarium mangiferae TaxID=192010 RepID=A0A1L7UJQ9_FUSMA|nr:related to tetracycline resistance proteins [Fusarium mangiferae]CVL07731.1 related to tetracycline resistance proteins [Fusarium mangiferae]
MSTFHPFTNLPVELRLQIWSAACLPSTSRGRGIQYVNVRDDKIMPLSCNWPLEPDLERSTHQPNRSAYLIDGGLWRACKESREVVRKHSRSKNWPGGEDAVRPAILTIREDEERWHMMVYSSRDIFAIRADNWRSIYEKSYSPRLYIPNNVSGTNVRRFVKNVAIEYDHKWSLNFPGSLYTLREENSARGYLAKLLIDRVSTRSKGAPENIWLIDKKALWMRNPKYEEGLHQVSTPKQNIATVYRDFDAEYIDVSWGHAVPRKDKIHPSSLDFVTKLGTSFDSQLFGIAQYLTSLNRFYEISFRITYQHFAVTHAVRLLVSPENEVKPCTKGCKTKCKDIGWCICSED